MFQGNLVGIDVGAQELVATIKRSGKLYPTASFENNAIGHRKLIGWATKRGRCARVCLEATGVYGLELAMALHRNKGTEVMVVNPRAIKDFARASMVRAKTDKVDSGVILDFLGRMPFQQWQPPREEVLELRAITRRIIQLKTELTRERNRHKQALKLASLGSVIAHDIDLNIRHLERRLQRLEDAGLDLVHSDTELSEKMDRLVTVKGIAKASAMRILAELLVLPDDMKAPQWVAHAGLDPRPQESGTSLNKPRRITKAGNRYLRAALYMPALVAIRQEPNIRAFYDKLVSKGKKPIQAVVAVMRKLLHAIWGMLKNDEDFIGEKFFLVPSEG